MTNIVLVTRDRFKLLDQTLESLYHCTDRDQFNLVVVDDGSSDFRCRICLDYYGARNNCSVLRLQNSAHVLSRLKNIGVAWSEQEFGRGDYLYLSDNDVVYTPGWLTVLNALHKASFLEGFRLLGGQVHPFHKPINGTDSCPLGFACSATVLREYGVLDGPSWLMTWATWKDYGPFQRDTAPGVCQSEEYPFCKRITERARIGAVDPPVVHHVGLLNSDGKPAPGMEERAALLPKGVITQ
jgi:glycosyltransferase involved in cell wall biosynthesis